MTESVPAASTRLLCGSDESLFQCLRVRLSERDVDPQTAILADVLPDDVDQEYGLVVTQDRRVIQFVVHYGRFGDLRRQAADAVIMSGATSPRAGMRRPTPPAIQIALDLVS